LNAGTWWAALLGSFDFKVIDQVVCMYEGRLQPGLKVQKRNPITGTFRLITFGSFLSFKFYHNQSKVRQQFALSDRTFSPIVQPGKVM
jgi:hypothetical protein